MENFDPPDAPAGTVSNVPEFSVSELSFALKREIETAFPRVRVRGEISQPSFPRSGHCYFRLKDENAVIDGVAWKGTIPRLGIKIEEGLEVIATGKLTTYAGSSRYQIIVDRLELAGEGALLKLLEDRRKKLQAEGLFDPDRKRALPFLPEVIGVVTSPSGAVIRDILHRLADRFPRHVLVWPVAVQGEKAAAEVAAAIAGFNRLAVGGPVPRPDVLIVARGGGSLEDLWAFNEEIVVRAAAASEIPLISAVGHETDTTLIDFVSDRRAPTPTAAAEMATPVLAELKGLTSDLGARLHRAGGRVVDDRTGRIAAADRALRRAPDMLRLAEQRFDIVSGRLGAGLARNAAVHERELVRVASRLTPLLLQRPQATQKLRLDTLTARLRPSLDRRLERLSERLESLAKLYASVDPDRPLQRGFARVARADGGLVQAGAALKAGETVAITFGDRVTRQAVIDAAATATPSPARPRPRAEPPPQGDLF